MKRNTLTAGRVCSVVLAGLALFGCADDEAGAQDASGPEDGKADGNGEWRLTTNPHLDIFTGYDLLRDEGRNSCVTFEGLDPNFHHREATSPHTEQNFSVVTSRQQLSEELKLDTQITAAVAGKSANSKVSMLNSFSRSTNTIHLLWRSQADYVVRFDKSGFGDARLGDPVITKSGPEYADSSQFITKCGANWVNGVKKAAGLYVMMRIEANSTASRMELETELGAGEGGISGSAAAKIGKFMETGDFTLTVDTETTGWQPSAEASEILANLGDANDEENFGTAVYEKLKDVDAIMAAEIELDMACENGDCAFEVDGKAKNRTVRAESIAVTLSDYKKAEGYESEQRTLASYVAVVDQMKKNELYLVRLADQIEKLNRIYYDELKPFKNAGSLAPTYNVVNKATNVDFREKVSEYTKILADATTFDSAVAYREDPTITFEDVVKDDDGNEVLDDAGQPKTVHRPALQWKVIPRNTDSLTEIADFWLALFRPGTAKGDTGLGWELLKKSFDECMNLTSSDPGAECGGDALLTGDAEEIQKANEAALAQAEEEAEEAEAEQEEQVEELEEQAENGDEEAAAEAARLTEEETQAAQVTNLEADELIQEEAPSLEKLPPGHEWRNLESLIRWYYHQYGRILPMQYRAGTSSVSGAFVPGIDTYDRVESECRDMRFSNEAVGELPTKEQAQRLAPLIAQGPLPWIDAESKWWPEWWLDFNSDIEPHAIIYRESMDEAATACTVATNKEQECDSDPDADGCEQYVACDDEPDGPGCAEFIATTFECCDGGIKVLKHLPPGRDAVQYLCIHHDDREILPVCVPPSGVHGAVHAPQ